MPELADYTQGSVNRQTQFQGNLILLTQELEEEINSLILSV